MSRIHHTVRMLTASGIATLISLATLVPAYAHVGVNPDSTAAGSTAMVDFAFSHGCGESPTTALVIEIPEEFTSVTPVFAPGWDIAVEKEPLDEPIEGSHGSTITERTSTVTFTADEPIANGIYATVTLRLTIPEDAEGETIYFPVIQECEEGETGWIEIAKEGEDPHDLESPAPGFEVTEPEDDGGH